MKTFLNLIAIFPTLTYILVFLYSLLSNHVIYENYHWLLVALIAFQASASRLKGVNSTVVVIFVSSILANVLLVLSGVLGSVVAVGTYLLFIGFLSVGFLAVMVNLALNYYKHSGANKPIKTDA